MKTTMKIGLLTLGLAVTGSVQAQQPSLEYGPGAPSSQISPAQLDALRGWRRNTQADIDRLLNSVQPILDSTDRKRKLATRMEAIAAMSEPNTADLILRHAIYAGLTVNKLIERETVAKGRDFTPEGTVDQQARILRRSLEIAREYYESDMKLMNGILTQRRSFSNPKLVDFGIRISKFLIKMSDGVLSAPANYGMIRWSLGILNNYMVKDEKNIAYAATIKYLTMELRNYPDIVRGEAAPDDAKCVQYVRELKRLALQAYGEIEQTAKNIEAPEVTGADFSLPRQQQHASTQAPAPRVETGNESDSYAQYEWVRENGVITYSATIPQSPVTHAGRFKSKPVSVRVNGETTVIGLGQDDDLYYISTSSPTVQKLKRVNSVVQIQSGATLNGLPAVKYVDHYGNRITLNIVNQSKVDQ